MNPIDPQCEQFEPLVSAMLDGELSGAELQSVNEHLAVCDSCRKLERDFGAVDDGVSLKLNRPADSQNGHTETFVVTRQKPSLKSWFSVWRLVPMATVAALMVGLFIVMTNQTAPDAAADQITPEEFVKPMAELNRINRQQQRDQEMMVRTLSMELRSLKLELKQLENAGAEDRARFENQIEDILRRVEKFEAS